MSAVNTVKSKKKKGHAPAHQNKIAWQHNPKSKKTDKILSSPISDCCRRCKEKLEWRKQYRKYKPLTQPATCNLCRKKCIKMAYHTVCKDCRKADGRDYCGICFKEKCGRSSGKRELSIEDECERAGPMKLREKKAFIRKLERERAIAAGEEGGDGDGDGGESCDEFDSSSDDEEPQLGGGPNIAEQFDAKGHQFDPTLFQKDSALSVHSVTLQSSDPTKTVVLENATVVSNGASTFLVTAAESSLPVMGEGSDDHVFDEVRFEKVDGSDKVITSPVVIQSRSSFLVKGGNCEVFDASEGNYKKEEVEGFEGGEEEEEVVDMEKMKSDMIKAFSANSVFNFAQGSAQKQTVFSTEGNDNDNDNGNGGPLHNSKKTDDAYDDNVFAKGDLFGCSSARNFPKFKF